MQTANAGRVVVTVFAKAPVAGLAKTRLAPVMGAAAAARLAGKLLQRAVKAACAAQLGSVELCVTPDDLHPALQDLARQHGLGLQLQGEGELGERMHRAIQRRLQQHTGVLLMGSDAPDLDATMLLAAAKLLQTHDAVFTPALDGGYALVGLKQPQAGLFEGMRWSHDRVMEDTRERARALGLRWAETAPVADIDLPADLCHLPAGWLAELMNLETAVDRFHPLATSHEH